MASEKFTISLSKNLLMAMAAVVIAIALAVAFVWLNPQLPGQPTPAGNIASQQQAGDTTTDLGKDLKSARGTIDDVLESIG